MSSRQAKFDGNHPYNGADRGPFLQRAEKVGRYPGNNWKIHDMHGNVFEWCRDWCHDRLPGGVDPDLSLLRAKSRVRRGGCFVDRGVFCQSATRVRFEPERRSSHIGFRVVAVSV